VPSALGEAGEVRDEGSAPPAVALVEAETGRLRRTVATRSAIFVVYVAAVLVIWQYAVRWSHTTSVVLPTPTEVWHEIVTQPHLLLTNTWVTSYESLVGLGISLLLGVALALVLAYWTWASVTVLPTVIALQAVPKVAVAPLIVIWFGLGVTSKIATVVSICFFPIFMNTARSLRTVEREYVDLVRGLHGTKWQLYRKIRVPWAIPSIATGLRIAVPFAMLGAIITEFIAAQKGLGFVILSASQNLQTPLTLAAIFFVTVATGLFYAIAIALERLVVRKFPIEAGRE